MVCISVVCISIPTAFLVSGACRAHPELQRWGETACRFDQSQANVGLPAPASSSVPSAGVSSLGKHCLSWSRLEMLHPGWRCAADRGLSCTPACLRCCEGQSTTSRRFIGSWDIWFPPGWMRQSCQCISKQGCPGVKQGGGQCSRVVLPVPCLPAGGDAPTYCCSPPGSVGRDQKQAQCFGLMLVCFALS